jgi:hypothetical protein
VLAEGGRQVAEHRVGVARDGHQVGGRGAQGDAFREAPKLGRLDAHVEGRAHVEAHRQPVQLGHRGVFETGAFELRGRAEDLGADEAGHVVDDHPRARLSADKTRDAVGARFEREHVHALGGVVGDGRPLAGLEVEAVEAARQIEHAFDIETDHPAERLRRAGETLKPHVDLHALARARLLHDVGEHAVARRQF